MSVPILPYPLTDGTFAYGSQVYADLSNIVASLSANLDSSNVSLARGIGANYITAGAFQAGSYGFVGASPAAPVVSVTAFAGQTANIFQVSTASALTVWVDQNGVLNTAAQPIFAGGTGFVTLSPAAQQTGSINVSGNATLGGNLFASGQLNGATLLMTGTTAASGNVTNNGLSTIFRAYAGGGGFLFQTNVGGALGAITTSGFTTGSATYGGASANVPTVQTNLITTTGNATLLAQDGTHVYLQAVSAGGSIFFRNGSNATIGFLRNDGYLFPDPTAANFYGPSASNTGGFTTLAGVTANGAITTGAVLQYPNVGGGYTEIGGTASGLTGPISGVVPEAFCLFAPLVGEFVAIDNHGNFGIAGNMGMTGSGSLIVNQTNALGLGSNAGFDAINFFSQGAIVAAVRAAGNYAILSDARTKRNIRSSPYGLDAVMQMRPIMYDSLRGPTDQLGFIAQEMQQIVPELVKPLAEGSDELGFEMATMVVVLTQAVQNLKNEFDAYRELHP